MSVGCTHTNSVIELLLLLMCLPFSYYCCYKAPAWSAVTRGCIETISHSNKTKPINYITLYIRQISNITHHISMSCFVQHFNPKWERRSVSVWIFWSCFSPRGPQEPIIFFARPVRLILTPSCPPLNPGLAPKPSGSFAGTKGGEMKRPGPMTAVAERKTLYMLVCQKPSFSAQYCGFSRKIHYQIWRIRLYQNRWCEQLM